MKINLSKKFSSGFTLIELLIVITIISALAVTVFVALNPAQRLLDARNARRTSDVDSILTALHTFIVDNKGTYPTGLASTGTAETLLGTGAAAVCSPVISGGCNVAAGTACVNLGSDLAKYLKSMPIDPTGGTTWETTKTGYSVTVDTNGLITVRSCGKEGTGANIEASR